MRIDLGGPPHEVPRWLREAELIGPVPTDLLKGRQTGRKTKAKGREAGLLLPDLAWNSGGRESIQRIQALGVRTVNYISFSIRPIPPPVSRKRRDPAGEELRREMMRSSFLARRPELAIYDARGVRQRCIFADQNSPYRIEICPNTPGVVEALEKEVRRMLRSGADAIFIDHVFGVSACHGERLGIHEHVYHEADLRGIPEEDVRFAPGTDAPNDDAVSNFAYAMLLKRMRSVLAEFGTERVLIGNTTFWPFKYSAKLKKYVLFPPTVHRRVPELFWRYLDCGMVESYILVPRSFVSSESNASVTVRWQTYSQWEREGSIPEKYRVLGRRLIALPYAGRRSDREDLFFAYAAARLDDLIWMGSAPRGTGLFCKIRLGRPQGEKHRTGGLLWCRFEHGLVALNPGASDIEQAVPVDWPAVVDYYAGKTVPVRNGYLLMNVPADAGRVFLEPSQPQV